MQYYPFDSRNPLYRNITGAVAAGKTVQLRLLLHFDAKVTAAYMLLRNDDEKAFKEIKMSPGASLENYRFWECEVTLPEGLYWYYFRYESDYGNFYVTKCSHSVGFVSNDGEYWQQTVYAEDFKTPDWLAGGIIYQIFPDRFYNSGKEKQNVPEDRYINTDWNKQPEYRQTNEKCSLGNDYYGGDLQGITEKLPYLSSLGVSCIYLNPIFEAHSNHRYNTADYFKIDSSLGTLKDFETLCKSAEKYGIRIILDGVFSHTGDNSIYFNRYGNYDSVGAYNSKESEYYGWYKFDNWPDKYESWWGVPSLPETVEENPNFREYITGRDGVIRYWMRHGAAGWRLDVADELPDSFISDIRNAAKQEKDDAYLLGEVWEDASNKISYGCRRKFLRGHELDSVMNYPFANAIIDFILGGDAVKLVDTVVDITENYPKDAVKVLMNHIGTHDTARIITRLSEGYSDAHDRAWQANQKLCGDLYQKAMQKVKLAAAIQYTLPGVPSVFYGDETGVSGYGDPFCRAAFPWDNINNELLEFYRKLGTFRRNCECFKNGEFIPVHSNHGYLVYMRRGEKDAAVIAVNINDYEVWAEMPDNFKHSPQVIFGDGPNNDGWIRLSPNSLGVYKIKM